MTKKRSWVIFLTRVFLALPVVVFSDDGAGAGGTGTNLPVRVFLLTGQSNMCGRGSIKMLTDLVNDEVTRATYQHLVDENNTWITRDDVKIYYPPITSKKPQPLTVGFGMSKGRFGPELEFGRIVGDDYEDGPTLLVKAAWGGKDLAVDFRPPSRGISNYTNREQGIEEWQQAKIKQVSADAYGKYYNLTIDTVHDALLRIEAGEVFDGYNTWELSGMVWFQGWNDMCTDDDRKLNEYEDNLAHFVRDLRVDLGKPDLPTVIGEFGQLGINPEGWLREHTMRLRRIQRSVAHRDEFRQSVRVAMTSTYVVDNGNETYDGFYHYNGRADTYAFIGQAFGQTMVHLIQDIDHAKRENATTAA